MSFDTAKIIDFVKEKKFELFGLAALLLVCGIIFNMVYFPMMGKIAESKKIISSSVMGADNLQRAKANSLKLKQDVAGLETQLSNMEGKLFLESETQVFLKYLNQLARSVNVRIVSLSPETPVKKEVASLKKVYLQIPYRAVLKCTYHDLGKFINRVESSNERFVKVEEVSIKHDSGSIWEHAVELEISIFATTNTDKK
jgi:Tfp pilus assembly protein PilO